MNRKKENCTNCKPEKELFLVHRSQLFTYCTHSLSLTQRSIFHILIAVQTRNSSQMYTNYFIVWSQACTLKNKNCHLVRRLIHVFPLGIQAIDTSFVIDLLLLSTVNNFSNNMYILFVYQCLFQTAAHIIFCSYYLKKCSCDTVSNRIYLHT